MLNKNINIDDLFIKNELIPAIAVDFVNGEVLMLAYMDKEALLRTLRDKKVWYYSRSREEYWNKGSTSGHWQILKSIDVDCDNDTLLLTVEQIGTACHTGNRSCFFTRLYEQKEEENE